MLFNRIKDLNPDFPDDRAHSLARRFIDDANRISGDIVLRAAKRGRNASELIGIVLSSFLVQHELGTFKKVGWYFLDDYSEWLGQREEQIADLLVLQPEVVDGVMRLTVVVTEAKYIVEPALTECRRESQKQLRDTVRRIRDALFGAPKRLDRTLWLSRFSDLLLSGIPYAAADTLSLGDFRRALRDGSCHINVRGYSHVFVSGPSDSGDISDFVEVSDCENSFQEVYSRTKTRALLAAYADNVSPGTLRESVVENDVIRRREFTQTSEITRLPVSVPKPTFRPLPPEGANGAGPTPPQPVTASTPTSGSDQPPPMSEWSTPDVAPLIAKHQDTNAAPADESEWQNQTVSRMRSALQQFQLNSKLLGTVLTPNAILLKFQGATNMTVDHILKRRSEFLTTHGLNIISVRPEAGAVSVAVARPNRQVLQMLDVWSRWHPATTHGNVKLLIGVQEENSELLFISPADNAPHTLIAGTTGSGKSVLVQNILLAIACTNTPIQSKIILIDPKRGVDYFAFADLPHLDGGIIDEQGAAIEKLTNLVGEMDRRYEVLRRNKVGDIYRLNAKSDASEHLPYLWIIHDEFAEWMMTDTYRDAIANIVSRLGVKARAAGIFLFFAAQRPDADVMPMQLRANLGNRLVLKVDSEGTSEISLGERNGGAERLLGKGHLAAKLVNVPSITFAQVPLISDEDIAQLVSALGG
jgi:S-DNA-T family DNA segregation ATPase FtsK/SpoIIIE